LGPYGFGFCKKSNTKNFMLVYLSGEEEKGMVKDTYLEQQIEKIETEVRDVDRIRITKM
jgi:hypothetical protein